MKREACLPPPWGLLPGTQVSPRVYQEHQSTLWAGGGHGPVGGSPGGADPVYQCRGECTSPWYNNRAQFRGGSCSEPPSPESEEGGHLPGQGARSPRRTPAEHPLLGNGSERDSCRDRGPKDRSIALRAPRRGQTRERQLGGRRLCTPYAHIRDLVCSPKAGGRSPPARSAGGRGGAGTRGRSGEGAGPGPGAELGHAAGTGAGGGPLLPGCSLWTVRWPEGAAATTWDVFTKPASDTVRKPGSGESGLWVASGRGGGVGGSLGPELPGARPPPCRRLDPPAPARDCSPWPAGPTPPFPRVPQPSQAFQRRPQSVEVNPNPGLSPGSPAR